MRRPPATIARAVALKAALAERAATPRPASRASSIPSSMAKAFSLVLRGILNSLGAEELVEGSHVERNLCALKAYREVS